jgi:hypothetical protein
LALTQRVSRIGRLSCFFAPRVKSLTCLQFCSTRQPRTSRLLSCHRTVGLLLLRRTCDKVRHSANKGPPAIKRRNVRKPVHKATHKPLIFCRPLLRPARYRLAMDWCPYRPKSICCGALQLPSLHCERCARDTFALATACGDIALRLQRSPPRRRCSRRNKLAPTHTVAWFADRATAMNVPRIRGRGPSLSNHEWDVAWCHRPSSGANSM